MTVKETFIQSTREARTHHVKWVNRIKLLVSGMQSETKSIPLDQTNSEFSRWLYREAMIFSTASASHIIDEMVELHSHCYDIYLRIYNTLLSPRKGGFIGVFGGSKHASHSDLMLAQHHYAELIAISDHLLARLRAFESHMLATAEAKFDELVIETPAETVESPKSDDIKNKIYFRGRLIEG